ncbi:hypothetical protein PAXRUDRAFT_142926 [Paxillus rubicundulus Ve08.2h10]|uniref:Uncharacterized protein n=1 Tax=Paxillus rubicundulus Ve08.2h10 TaxID=930991 RepID=A0A0D0E7W9_9AGAM|nr:hypothetical protein PAXRUDRAFT_142926 [Paxillus rubicundulus Ve08.2h10]
MTAGVIMALPAAGMGILGVLGFSPTGPVAGSFAAWFQSAVFGGATGGVFSIVQSFAMSTGTWPAILLLVGCATFGLGYFFRYHVAPRFRAHSHNE